MAGCYDARRQEATSLQVMKVSISLEPCSWSDEAHIVNCCSRVVEAQSPLAIVIPADGKASCLRLRNGDMLWSEFVAKANHLSR